MRRPKEIIKSYLANLEFVPMRSQLIAKIINNYYKLIALQKPRLRVVTLAINYACQLSCIYCSVGALKKKEHFGERLSLSQIERVLHEAEECGAINIHFSGGEPLLDKDFYKIASLVDKNRNILSLVTNGLLLEQESENLKKAKFDLVIVSIDSPHPEIHDKIRGYVGAYRKAWDGIEAAHRIGLKVMIAMVVTPDNLSNGEVDKFITLCRYKKIKLQILPIRNNNGARNEKKMLLSAAEQAKFYKYISHFNVRWDGQSSYFPSQCLAARERLYINPCGDVFACDFIQFSFGNVKNESLMDIWYRMLNTYPFNQKNSVCLSAFDKEFINNFTHNS
jgi:MoaA/NifB/PqqE/SkfB family radical SAM enzyme